MRKTVGLLCCLALTAAAVGAQGGAPHDLAALLGISQPIQAASMEKATCTANCAPDPYVTCTTANPSSSCVAVDRNCSANQRGYVTCDGVTKYCASTCPVVCTEGAFRGIPTGYCCENGRKERDQQQCINGQWQYTGEITCMGPCAIYPEYPEW